MNERRPIVFTHYKLNYLSTTSIYTKNCLTLFAWEMSPPPPQNPDSPNINAKCFLPRFNTSILTLKLESLPWSYIRVSVNPLLAYSQEFSLIEKNRDLKISIVIYDDWGYKKPIYFQYQNEVQDRYFLPYSLWPISCTRIANSERIYTQSWKRSSITRTIGSWEVKVSSYKLTT